MQLERVLRELRAERELVVRAIELLEQRITPKARRGRKSMDATERREVSRRMKDYWAKRRGAKAS